MAGGKREGAGRKRGSPNKATAEVRNLALEHGPAAIAELARLSTEAQSEAARIAACNAIVERAYGKALTGRMVELQIPDTSTVDGVSKAIAQIVQTAASGHITPGEASDFCGLLESQRRAIELSEIEMRLARLEGAQEGRP